MIASILLDRHALMGLQQHSLSWTRVLAAALLIGGTLLMSR